MTAPISVIIPCAFMAGHIPDALGSIERQDVPAGEVIVVRPEEDEATARACQAGRARLPIVEVVHPLSSPGEARNAGLARATGRIIVFLDADDVLPAGRFALQMKRLEREPGVDAVGGLLTKFERLDATRLEPEAGSFTETQCGTNPGIWMLRRQVLDTIGGFDPELRYAEDLDLVLRMRDHGIPFTVLDTPVLFYRQHAGSMMRQQDRRMVTDFAKAAFKSSRRRAALGLPPATRQVLTDDIEPVAAGDAAE